MKTFRFPFQLVVFVVLFCFFIDLHVFGQFPSPSLSSPELAPETGLLSPSRYTNAFFGFSISLPQETK